MSTPAAKVEPHAGLSEVTPLPPAERSQQSAKADAKALRRQRSARLARQLGLFVLLPTLLAAVYFAFWATPQYESYAIFAVQSSELRPNVAMDGLLAGLASGAGGHDALAVRDYIASRDMLARLDKEHGVIAHYKDSRNDLLSRLRGAASFEEAYEYFGRKVDADYDQVSGSVTVRVRAFSADKAVSVARALLDYSEAMVNKLSERERRDRTGFAEAEVKKAEQRLAAARLVIVALQEKHEDFNPLQSAAAAMTVRTSLQAELAKARAELMQMKSYMQDDAPQVRASLERVKSLSAQVAGESRKLVDPTKPNGLNAAFADFEGAMVEKEFAQKAYESAMATLEMARADADRQHRYVAVIAAPSKPDESTYPHGVRSVLAALVISGLLWGIVRMMLAAVQEHARL
jgi:capsular polysaccharide transport system permease protein